MQKELYFIYIDWLFKEIFFYIIIMKLLILIQLQLYQKKQPKWLLNVENLNSILIK